MQTKDPDPWVRQNMKRMDYAPNVQLQGGAQAMKAIKYAVEKSIAAATMSTKEPKMNPATGNLELDHSTGIPRVRVLLAVLNEVADTPMHGGTFGTKLDRHKREIPELTIVSSSEQDCKHVVKALCGALTDPDELLFDYFKVFGTGKETVERFHKALAARKLERSKKAVVSKNHREAGAAINNNLAPVIGRSGEEAS